MDKENIEQRLKSAQKRLDDLCALNQGNLPGANAWERQQLVQEFFFHRVGAIEVLAQCVNDAKVLGLDSEEVTVSSVIKALPSADPIAKGLCALYMNTRKAPVPPNPYSEDGLIFRAYNYRNQVTHRGTNPFLFRVGSSPPASFHLDPRDANLGHSDKAAQDEMRSMKELISQRCGVVLALL